MPKPNWQALSTIAELIGAAAVVVSLVYVAAEIRQNTQQVEEGNRLQRVAQLEAAYDNFSRIRQMSAGSSEVTRIWLRGLEDPEALDDVESARFEAMLGEFWNASQVLYARVEEGVLYPEVWGDLLGYLETLLQQPGARFYWSASKEGYRSEFVAAVEEYIGAPPEGGATLPDSAR